jgi:hypothetical protein
MKIMLKKPLITIGKMPVVLPARMNIFGTWPSTSYMALPQNLAPASLALPNLQANLVPAKRLLHLKNNLDITK